MNHGFDYELIRSERKTIAVQIKAGRVIVRAPLRASMRTINRFIGANEDRIEAYLEKARKVEEVKRNVLRLTPEEIKELKKRAKEVIPRRAEHFAPIVGVEYQKISIRMQKTRWGSCSGKGNLSFNCLLMLAPPEVVDGVVVHELCHIISRDHSARFYREVERVLPDYKKRAKWLKENSALILAAAGKE
ncbi:MAG: M48 family metallopeptidase [Clostridiales bacterium]|nr:M48 family metallopeptidase [Clostridiales bacterium]